MTAPAEGDRVGQAKTTRHDSGRSKVPIKKLSADG
jgi:hypothetical protein